MSTHHEANDRAMRRCEEAYLREPEPPACEACGAPASDGTLCEPCAEEIAAIDAEEAEDAASPGESA